MENSVTVKQANQVAVSGPNMSWGSDEIESTDIRVPRLLLMQSQSEAVGQRKAALGDMVDSIMMTKLGDDKTPVNVVPIYVFKNWRIEEKREGKFEYKEVQEYTPSNANRPKEEILDGKEVRNVLTINLLCMLEKDLEDPSALPYLISFRMTSYKTGQDISTIGLRARNVNKPMAVFTISLGCEFVKNDKGQYFVFKTCGVKETKDFAKYSEMLYKWYQVFRSGRVKVDEVEEQAETPTTANFEGQF